MREIKFRAWNGKTMLPNVAVEGLWDGINDVFRLLQSLKWMQYTGLKDKNGKEIYEGDIVQYPEEHGGSRRQVMCKPGYFFFKTIGGDGWQDIRGEGDEQYFGYEVIGNIYENPELIKH